MFYQSLWISIVAVFAIAVPLTIQADPTILSVAHGASVNEVCHRAFAQFESKGTGKVKTLHDGGVSGDSILYSVDRHLADLGVSGNSFEAMTQTAQNKKITLTHLSQIMSRRLGAMTIALITYPGGPKKLTAAQVKQLLTGQVNNWKDVGGDDLPIQLVVPTNTTATQESISKLILDGEGVQMRGTKVIDGMTKVIEFVAQNKGSLSFVNAQLNLSSVNRPAHPNLRTDVTAITLGEPSPPALALMDIISKQLE